MESYALPGPAYPADLQEITLALWTDIPNAGALRERLIKAPTMSDKERKQLDYAFLEGTMIVSRNHVLVAAHQAILSAAQDQLQTQTVHSELIHHLNPTNNIGEGLRRFGISAKSTSCLLVKVGKRLSVEEKEQLQQEMAALTRGNLASLDDLEKTADWASLRKYYKIPANAPINADIISSCTALNKTVGIF